MLVKNLFQSLIWVVVGLTILPTLLSIDNVIILLNPYSCLAPVGLSLLYLTRVQFDILWGSILHLNSISFTQFSRSNIILISDMSGK